MFQYAGLFALVPQVDTKERANKASHGPRGGAGSALDEAESAGNNASGRLSEPYKILGDAGTILRDPSAMHLLLATALKVLQGTWSHDTRNGPMIEEFPLQIGEKFNL